MINSNKRWLLTASPWMRHSLRLSRLAIGGLFFTALLVFVYGTSKAQTRPGRTGGVVRVVTPPVVTPGTLPAIPVITGGTTVCVGTSTTLTNTTPGGVWTSSNPSVATVGSTTGIVTGQHGGVVVITYSVGPNSISTTVTVTYPITGLSTVCTGNTINLTDTTATGLWSVDNPSIATVSVTGVVTGVSAGTATITFGRAGACTVTQTVNVVTNTNVISPALPVVCVGNTTTLTGTPSSGTWTSSNVSQATIGASTGIATGIAAGNPTMTYTTPTYGCYSTKTLIVNATAPAAIGGAGPVCIGNTITLTEATPLGTWSSSDITKATVNSAGVVTGLAVGNPTISYTKNGCSAFATVAVSANITTAITGNTSLCVSGTTTLSNTTPGGVWSTTSSLISLSGSTGSSVTVTAGVSTGTAIVTYGVPGSCYQSISLTINPSTSVGALSGPTAVCQGSSITLTDAMPGGTWSSSNTAIGSVDAYGHVKGVAVAGGTVTITYTRLACTISQVVTVNALPTIGGTASVCISGSTTLTPAGNTWSSANTAIATVGSSTGVVTGVAGGVVGISYTDINGCSAVKQVSVNGPTPIILPGGNNVACKPLSTGGIGTFLYLTDGTSGGTWSSGATAIATISSTGVVTPVTTGTVTITYTKSGCAVTQLVSVNQLPALITGSFATCVGSATTLADVTAGGTWSSSNLAAGTVSPTGSVYGVAPGGTTISYTVNGCAQNANVTVGAALGSITSTSVHGFNVCTGYAKDTLLAPSPGGIWTASNTKVLISGGSASAVVTGYSTGSSTITYSLGGCYTTATITVSANSVSSITGVPYACTGLTTTLTDPFAGGVWSVRDPIATAATGTSTTGIITGVSAGTTVVTYTNPADGCFKTFVFNVEPQPAVITGANSVCDGLNDTLADVTTGGSWLSNNTDIATVTALGTTNGVVKGISAGLATITYALPGGCYSLYPVAVKATPASIVYKSKHSGAVCTDVSNLGHIAIAYDSVVGGTWSNPSGSVTFGTAAPYGGTDSVQIIAGVTTGTTVITYTLPDGCFSTATVTVGGVVPSFSDPNNPTPWNYCQGGTLDTLVLGGVYSGGLRSWTVLNQGSMFVSNIASISNSSSTFSGGGLQGIAAGVATVTYTFNGCWATHDITVNPNPSVGISGPSALCTTGLGNTFTLTDGSFTGGTWVSNNTAVATVGSASGLAAGVSVGSAIISYAVRYGGCIDVLPVNVNSVTPVAITPTVNPTPLCVGDATTLSDATGGGVWSSSDTSKASVDAIGIVYGVGAGSLNITYNLNGCYVTQPVSVNALPTFTGTGQLCALSTATLNPTPAGGTWSTRSTAQATIGSLSGIVTATPTGNGDTVTIFYTYNGCRGVGIDTIGAAVTTFTMSPTLCTGNTVSVTPSPSSKWVNTWMSSNPLVAFVGGAGTFASGAVTGIAGSGGGVVTVSYTPPGCATVYTTTVNVIDAGTISGSFAVCSTGVAAVTALAENSTGGSWSISNGNAALSGTTDTTAIVTGSVPGYDTVAYTVISGGATCKATQQIIIMACGPKETQPGANTPVSQKYTLFPNPSNGYIAITQSVPEDGVMPLTVINYVGATIYNGAIDFAGGTGEINLSNVVPGMYLVMLKDNKGKVQTFKVIIEK